MANRFRHCNVSMKRVDFDAKVRGLAAPVLAKPSLSMCFGRPCIIGKRNFHRGFGGNMLVLRSNDGSY
jgi:hypothetical protein